MFFEKGFILHCNQLILCKTAPCKADKFTFRLFNIHNARISLFALLEIGHIWLSRKSIKELKKRAIIDYEAFTM